MGALAPGLKTSQYLATSGGRLGYRGLPPVLRNSGSARAVFALCLLFAIVCSIDTTRSEHAVLWRGDGGALFATLPAGNTSMAVGDEVRSGSWRGRVTHLESRGSSRIAFITGPTTDAPADLDVIHFDERRQSLPLATLNAIRNSAERILR